MFVVTWLPKKGGTIKAGPFETEALAEAFATTVSTVVPTNGDCVTVYEMPDHEPIWAARDAQDAAVAPRRAEVAPEPVETLPDRPVAERFVAALGLARRGGVA